MDRITVTRTRHKELVSRIHCAWSALRDGMPAVQPRTACITVGFEQPKFAPLPFTLLLLHTPALKTARSQR